MRLSNIFASDNWHEIGLTLARNKTRTFLTAFGIFWGTAMLALLWGGADGFKGLMSKNFAGISTNMSGFTASERTLSYRGFNRGSSWDIRQRDLDNVRRVAPAIEYMSELLYKYASTAYNATSANAIALGVTGDYGRITEPVILEGRFINDSDYDSSRKVAVVGRNAAQRIFGGDDPVGKYFSLNGAYFLCVGVATQVGEASVGARISDAVIIPSSTMRRAFNMDDRVSFVVFTSPSGHKPSENFPAIRRVLAATHVISPDDLNAVYFMDVSEWFEMIDGMTMGLSLLALFVGLGSLMAGVVGVGNIMWVVVKERTHEFGIRRALGATPADITMQVLSESVILTLVAGVAGVCFAAAILGVVDHVTADPLYGSLGFQLPFGRAAGIVLVFIILGAAAGTLPAIKAMKIKPIEAIQDK